jgi:hypothetical protein
MDRMRAFRSDEVVRAQRKSRNIKKLEQVLIATVCQLSRNLL